MDSKDEKKRIIQLCDSAFSIGLCGRDDFCEIFDKIDQNAIFITEYRADEVCGYAAMYCNDYDSQTAYITMIGVRKEFQRQHIGSKLMNECIFRAQKNGMRYLRLEVYNDNHSAMAFYQSFGFVFEEVPSTTGKYMIKELNMGKAVQKQL